MLRANLHILVFIALTASMAILQLPPTGWPLPDGGFGWVNGVCCFLILVLAMTPFGYDQQPTTTLGALFVFTFAAALSTALLQPTLYFKAYQPHEQALIIFLATMTVYGILSAIWKAAAISYRRSTPPPGDGVAD